MNKKILISIIGIALASAILTGVTVAYFMDQETSKGNTFAAGSLDLAVNTENPWTSKLVTLSDVKPSDSGSYDVKVENVGTINGSKLSFKLENITEDKGTTPESETLPDNGELCANIDVKLMDGTTELYTGKLNGFTANVLAAGLDAGASRTLKFEYSIASTVDNVIQGDKCSFDITATLEQ